MAPRSLVRAKTIPSHLIKRYGGSRLYDTSTGSYVTLGDIRRLASASRADVAIVDAKTGEDITRLFLLPT